MSKEEFVYHNKTLFVNLSGEYNSKNINNLKRKLYNIIDQYGINDIIIDNSLDKIKLEITSYGNYNTQLTASGVGDGTYSARLANLKDSAVNKIFDNHYYYCDGTDDRSDRHSIPRKGR